MQLEAAVRRRRRLTLTALVDVVFILLFFFMLATRPPAPQALVLGAAVSPGSVAAPGSASPVSARVLAGGRLLVDGQEVALAGIGDWLAAHRIGRLVLSAAVDARLQDLVGVLEALRETGIDVQLPAAAP